MTADRRGYDLIDALGQLAEMNMTDTDDAFMLGYNTARDEFVVYRTEWPVGTNLSTDELGAHQDAARAIEAAYAAWKAAR